MEFPLVDNRSERIPTVFQEGQCQQLEREQRILSKELTPTNNSGRKTRTTPVKMCLGCLAIKMFYMIVVIHYIVKKFSNRHIFQIS